MLRPRCPRQDIDMWLMSIGNLVHGDKQLHAAPLLHLGLPQAQGDDKTARLWALAGPLLQHLPMGALIGVGRHKQLDLDAGQLISRYFEHLPI